MNILIVSQYYNPEQFQINDIAPGLAKEGHNITVLCGIPNYPTGKIFKGYRLGKRKEIIEGVAIRRCFQFARGKGKISLALNYVSFAISGSIHVLFLKKKYDAVICYQLSPVTMAYPALLYKKMTGCPVFLYCLDIFPESVLSHCSRESRLYDITSKISMKIYKACDLIGVTSKPFIDYMGKVNNVPKEKMIYIPQHANDEMLAMDFSGTDNGVIDFMFAGNVGFGQNLETLVDAVEIIKDKNFMIHIVGNGSRKEFLEKVIREKHLENKFIFYGNKPRREMPSFYKMADILIITLRGDNAVGDTMPGKLQTYMTTGKPIVGAINGAAREIIEESNCGLCGPAGDAKTLAGNMERMIAHPEKFEEYGKNARKYFIDNFSYKVILQEWDTILTKIK